MRWIVVGAGAAGCVVAARLSEQTDDTVVLVEQGPDLTSSTTPKELRDVDLTAALESDRVDRRHFVRRRRGGPLERYMVGRGVGGSGVINGMLMERGDADQYRSWRWSDTDEALSRVLVPATSVDERLLGPVDRALLAADASARRAELAMRSHQRVTVADVYLDIARGRPNMTVHTGSPVDRVALTGRRATGISLTDGTAIEGDAVVLCAGALVSPTILLRSGTWDVPIGSGLQDHPSATINLRLRTTGADPAVERVATGVIAGDHQTQIVSLDHVARDGDGRHLGALTVALLRPCSRGAVTLDETGTAHIEMNELEDPSDLDGLVRGVGRLARLVADPLVAELIDDADGRGITIDDAGTPLSSLKTPGDIEAWLMSRPVGGTYLHAAASCPMGEAVDETARVLGTPNLFVLDASIFPSVPAAPTYLPTLMLAERMVPRLRPAFFETR